MIRAFGFRRVSLTITDVAEATGLTRATARRFLLTLVRMGYVRNDGREYWLRPRVLELGYAYLSGMTLPEAAGPFLDELVQEVGESTSIAVRDGDEIVYVAHEAPQRVMTINVPIGGRDPLYCTALGRVLLAAESPEAIDEYLNTADLQVYTRATVTDREALRGTLARVRADGYSLIEDELEDGLVALAVPILDGETVIAAMNLCAYSLRTGPGGAAQHRPAAAPQGSGGGARLRCARPSSSACDQRPGQDGRRPHHRRFRQDPIMTV